MISEKSTPYSCEEKNVNSIIIKFLSYYYGDSDVHKYFIC